MNYMKTGFLVAVGWRLGASVFDATGAVCNNLVKHYVPDQYRKSRSRDYIRRTKSKK